MFGFTWNSPCLKYIYLLDPKHMIRLLPERTDHSTKKRNKSYTEGVKSHTSETQSLNNHPNL